MFLKKDYDILNFEKATNPFKKYRVHIKNKRSGDTHWLEFGAAGYQQYKDSTPLKLYSDLDHLNDHRRDLFRKRFAHQYKPTELTPLYFSWRFLW